LKGFYFFQRGQRLITSLIPAINRSLQTPIFGIFRLESQEYPDRGRSVNNPVDFRIWNKYFWLVVGLRGKPRAYSSEMYCKRPVETQVSGHFRNQGRRSSHQFV